MINRDFWYDVLRSGAILGVVMALSHIAELYLLAYSGVDIATMSIYFLLEWLVAAAVFVWLLVRFSKRRAAAMDPKYGYSYSLALSYILMISMLAGIIVGATNTIFIGTMGYDTYIDGMVGRVDEIRALYVEMNIDTLDSSFNEMVAALRSAEQPSMLSTIFSSFNSYLFAGGIIGLVVSAFVRIKPQIINTEDNE